MELAGNKQKGIGLLELMLSFTVIAILLVSAARYYNLTQSSEKVHEAMNMIVAVYEAGESWLQSNADFTGVSLTTFINNGTLPKDYANQNVNPWYGNIIAQISPKGNKQSLIVALSNVPLTDCNNLREKLKHKFPKGVGDCWKGSFYITFDMSTS